MNKIFGKYRVKILLSLQSCSKANPARAISNVLAAIYIVYFIKWSCDRTILMDCQSWFGAFRYKVCKLIHDADRINSAML